MLLSEILHQDVVATDLQGENKYEIIEELVDLLVDAHEIPLSLRDHIVDVVTERERSMSTGMEFGVALPHGASDKIDDMIGAIGISQHDIPFETLDGQPVRLVILLLMPRKNYQGHVRTLAGIAHLLNNASLREALIKARNPETVLRLIEQGEDSNPAGEKRAKR